MQTWEKQWSAFIVIWLWSLSSGGQPAVKWSEKGKWSAQGREEQAGL